MSRQSTFSTVMKKQYAKIMHIDGAENIFLKTKILASFICRIIGINFGIISVLTSTRECLFAFISSQRKTSYIITLLTELFASVKLIQSQMKPKQNNKYFA